MDNQNGRPQLEDISSNKKDKEKTTLAGVLNGILAFILFMIALAAIGLVIGFIALMINPQLETFNSYDDFRLLYEFSPISPEKNYEVIQSNPALSSPEVKLLGSINFQIGNRGFVVLFFAFYFVMVTWFVNIIFQLRNFLGSFKKGNPFIHENVKRIRIIGWAVILFPILGVSFKLYFVPYFKNITLSSGIGVWFYWRSFLEFGKDSFWVIIFGLVVLVIAESFRIATQIKEEQDLTI